MAQNKRLARFVKNAFLQLLALFTIAMFARAQSAASPSLMPIPAKMQLGSGVLKIDANFRVLLSGYREPRLERAGQRFMAQLQRQTGIVFAAGSAQSPGPSGTLNVTTDHESKPVQELGEDESYTLDISSDAVSLHAPNPLGVLRGLQTFLQLVSVTANGFAVPFAHIQDQPRFRWRGLLIDSSRHFTPLEVLKRNLDGMEAVKMNVFHWHLSDDQGFRVESRKYPKLHELGSDGFFYTQDEIRELIAYARDRGIRVVPEFDMPGHSTSWFVGYPELASAPGPYQIERGWGVFDPAMDPTDEKTYKFLNEFIGEMSKLFPDRFFHIGGDEVNGKQWDASSKVQEFKKTHGITNTEGLQAYFSGRVRELVTKHGKLPVGWDEILVPGVSKSIVIQSWRGPESLAAAAKQGYRGILSNGYYLDLGWSAERHYVVDPLGGAAASLTPEQQQLILGGESCMWSEYVNGETIDSRIWPRNAAIAERLWSPQGEHDAASMYARMDAESERLEWLGLTHRTQPRKMLQRIAGPVSPEEFKALQTLGEVLEPVKDYNLERLATVPFSSQTPLNRLVSTVQMESEVSRRFSEDVSQFLAASCQNSAQVEHIRNQLREWGNNDARLRSLAQRSFLIEEVLPASIAFSEAAALALNALDRISEGLPLPEDSKKQQVGELDAYEQQANRALLTIPTLPAFAKLVESAAAGGRCQGNTNLR